jgi:hypothetical protein
MQDPSISRAETFLRSRGFDCEKEPTWVSEGKKPDFFCQGRASIWVEVKTLSATVHDKKRAYQWDELQHRGAVVPAHGSAHALVSESATTKDIKVAIKLAQLLLAEFESKEHNWYRAFIVIPCNPVYDEVVRLNIVEEEGTVLMMSCESRSGRYELPFTLEPKSYEQPVSIIKNNRVLNPVLLHDLIEEGDPKIVLEIMLGPDQFRIESFTPIGSNSQMHNSQRLRDCVKYGNAQLRNGQKYRNAPSVLLVYQDDILVPSDVIIVATLYGDLKWSFPMGNPNSGRFLYGMNGAFGPNKNRAVSALCMIRNNSPPFTIHNFWGNPFPPGLLGGREVICNNDGRFEFRDHS